MTEDQIEDLFRDIEINIEDILETIRVKELRKGHTYVEDLIRVLLPHKGGLTRGMVLHILEKNRRDVGLPIPPKFENAVQRAFNQNCLGYSGFDKRNLSDVEAPFYAPGGKGSGVWAVNPAWLKNARNK